jgi:1-acyl-sn-glycerol-3-phosphate acyltransferase
VAGEVLARMQPAEKASEPGEKRRRILRRLYLPWTWLVFIPYLAVSTIVFGTLAFLTSLISKNLSFHCGTAWAWLLCRMNFTWVSVKGRQHVKKGQSYIIMSNHQSHFDILAFYGHWGWQFRWVMKQELRKVPGLGYGCASVGHIFIDRSDREKAIASLKAAKPLLEGGISVMFFPEGTRSRDGRMLPFKKGGFMMALDLDLPILPVTIRGSRHVLVGKKLQLLPGLIRIQIHEPIEVSPYGHEKRDQLMRDVRKVIASGMSAWEQGEENGQEKH